MRILLAEDEKELSQALVAILKYNHYSVDSVYDGEEALLYAEAEAYDAVILDIMMPKLDGIQVLKALRKQGNTVPVLLLTAKSQVEDKVLGLDSGADDYLSKPFDAKELLARIRSITRRQYEVLDSHVSFSNITLNRANFEISTSKESCKLSNKEFQIMELLMMNQGNILSAERMMEKIWGYDSDAELNVVWVHISYLRKKLEKIGARAQIKATRNLGYSLEESTW